MSTYIYSWNRFSEGARALSEAMGAPRIKHEGSRFRPSPRKTVINWGSSNIPQELYNCRILNPCTLVMDCSNKLKFFRSMECANGPRIPDFTTDREVALQWLASGSAVCARTVLSGSGGAGLTIAEPNASPDSLPVAPLYTKYVKKAEEYRVHVVNGEVIDVQKKGLRRDFEGVPNPQVRNLANGYIYMRENVVAPDDVIEQALRGMRCSGLDFGACDIVWNRHYQQAYLLEINTAPGLSGTTLIKYSEALARF